MPIFSYKVIDRSGKKIAGTSEASKADALEAKLISTGHIIISIEEKTSLFDMQAINDFLSTFSKVKIDDLVMYTVQLANMLSAGIPLPLALSTMEEQTENSKLKKATKDICDNIKQGLTFSESLSKHKDIFSNLFINMIAAGETAGNLDEVLTRLVSFIEHENDLKQRISSAMMYPVILMIVGVLVVSFIVTSVLPPFAKIFMDANIPLPLPTHVLYLLNLFIRAVWIYAIFVVTGLFFVFKWWSATARGKMIVDTFKLKLPVWGDLLRKVSVARLTRTLAALLSSGVPMIRALEVTEKTIDLAPMAEVVNNVASAVGKGENMSEPLKASGQFPPMTIHMIAVGEETGTLETMLNKIADFYDLSTDYSMKKLTALIEPLFLVIIGSMVGFIFASILMPIFQMVKVLKH